jgi:hypothetical protein
MKDMYKIICILHEGSRIQSEFIPKHARFRSAGSAAFFRSSFCVRARVCVWCVPLWQCCVPYKLAVATVPIHSFFSRQKNEKQARQGQSETLLFDSLILLFRVYFELEEDC